MARENTPYMAYIPNVGSVLDFSSNGIPETVPYPKKDTVSYVVGTHDVGLIWALGPKVSIKDTSCCGSVEAMSLKNIVNTDSLLALLSATQTSILHLWVNDQPRQDYYTNKPCKPCIEEVAEHLNKHETYSRCFKMYFEKVAQCEYLVVIQILDHTLYEKHVINYKAATL